MSNLVRKHQGFTLMEVLIVLVIFGLLMLGLNRGMQFGLKAWNVQARTIAARDQLDATDRALRLLVGQIVPSSAGQQQHFTGASDKMDFTTEMPESMALSTRIADASLMLDGSKLVLHWTPHFHEHRTGPPPDPMTSDLVDGVSRLTISYYQPADQSGNGAGWRNDWDEPIPPVLFRFHIEFGEKDPRNWPDFVVAATRDQPS